jgi:nucleotide-binding universal stress UspA family protein
MKFLVPTDGSENADRAVQHVIDLARCRESVEVLLLNVRAPVDAWEVRRFLNDEEIAELQKKEGEDDLRSARLLLDASGVPYSAHVVTGPVAQTIADFAEQQGCNYIVMGTHGRGGLASLFLGSTAAKVVHLAKMPVTLVK